MKTIFDAELDQKFLDTLHPETVEKIYDLRSRYFAARMPSPAKPRHYMEDHDIDNRTRLCRNCDRDLVTIHAEKQRCDCYAVSSFWKGATDDRE